MGGALSAPPRSAAGLKSPVQVGLKSTLWKSASISPIYKSGNSTDSGRKSQTNFNIQNT